jgi:hypothetical protein
MKLKDFKLSGMYANLEERLSEWSGEISFLSGISDLTLGGRTK